MGVVGTGELQSHVPYLSHGGELHLGVHREPHPWVLGHVWHRIGPPDLVSLPGKPPADLLRGLFSGVSNDRGEQFFRDYDHRQAPSANLSHENGRTSTGESSPKASAAMVSPVIGERSTPFR